MAEILLAWNRQRDTEKFAKQAFNEKIIDVTAGTIEVNPDDCIAQLCDVCQKNLNLKEDSNSNLNSN